MSYILTVDQSISNTGWCLHIDGRLNSFGSFGSKMGSKKADKDYVLMHFDSHFENFLGKIEKESIETKVLRTETDSFQRVKFSAECFSKVLKSEVGSHKCHIVFEGLSLASKGNATRDIAGLLFSMISANLDFGQYSIVSPKSAKKCFTGNGNATKLDVIKKLPKDVRTLFLEAGYKYSEKNGEGSLNDLADSYSFYKWYLKQEK